MSTAKTLDISDSLLASLLSDENFCPGPAGVDRRDGPGRGVHRAVDLQVPGRVRHEQGPFHRRPHLPAVQHHRAAAGHAANQPDRGPRRLRPVQRLLLQPDHAGPHAGDVVPGRLRLRRAGARAADGLRDLRRGPVDHRRGPGPGETGRGRARTSRSIPSLFESLGPAINSGAGMFLYGAPGNGKSTLAKRITLCFGQEIWIPHALYEDGQIIKFYDTAYHKPVHQRRAEHHQVRRARPPLAEDLAAHRGRGRRADDGQPGTAARPAEQRQRGPVADEEQLRLPADRRFRPAADRARRNCFNRWIVPLEMRHDFLTLPTGKKLQVPFDQLVIFSTNLEPRDLVDEAFLRRIPFKIEIGDPSEEEFRQLFQLYARVVRLRVSRRGDRGPAGAALPRRPAGGCGAARPATCCCRSAVTAITPASRWNCAASISTAR